MAYDDVLGRIYDAAADPDGWLPLMERLTELVGGHSAWLSRLDVGDGSGSGMVSRIDPAAQAAYFAHFIALDPLSNVDDSGGAAALPAPYVITDESRLPKAELLRTEFYNDFMKRQDAHSVLMVRLAVRGMTAYGMNINRAARQGRFGAADIALLSSLQQHLTRSIRLAEKLGALRQLLPDGGGGSRSPGQGPDQGPHQGLVLLDGHGRIVFADATAERLIRDRNGLTVVTGRLSAVAPVAARRLQALVAAAAAPARDTRRGGSMAVQAEARRLPLLLSVAPLRPGRLPLFDDACAVAVAITDPQVGAHSPAAQLAELFGLTPAEVRVTLALLDGSNPKQIADALRLSVHTVRVHVAHVLGKVGVRRQTDLVRLLARLPGPGTAPHPFAAGQSITGSGQVA